jgi:nucleotide-binding universal stress UspA family protein
MKLLLAIDGSRYSEPAVEATLARPWPPGSVVRVLTVEEPAVPLAVVPEAALVSDVAAFARATHGTAQEVVRDTRAKLDRGNLPVEVTIRQGDARKEIVEEARSWGADLVLMGSHGRTGLERMLMGSVAQYVVAHAPCSVEVVREKQGR